jgi:hypothetical protein
VVDGGAYSSERHSYISLLSKGWRSKIREWNMSKRVSRRPNGETFTEAIPPDPGDGITFLPRSLSSRQ